MGVHYTRFENEFGIILDSRWKMPSLWSSQLHNIRIKGVKASYQL